jgi:hypothetical protein
VSGINTIFRQATLLIPYGWLEILLLGWRSLYIMIASMIYCTKMILYKWIIIVMMMLPLLNIAILYVAILNDIKVVCVFVFVCMCLQVCEIINLMNVYPPCVQNVCSLIWHMLPCRMINVAIHYRTISIVGICNSIVQKSVFEKIYIAKL